MESRTLLTPAVPDPRPALPGSAQPAATGVSSAPMPRKLDLSGMTPPMKLSEARLEDLTIDGICGVY